MAQQPVAEALVVVHEVEVAQALLERLEARRLKASGSLNVPVENCSTSTTSCQRLELPVGGEAAGVVVVEDVEAGQLVQR